MERRFDSIVVVDWSAAGRPRQGRDSIWIACAGGGAVTLENPPTRALAMARLAGMLGAGVASGRRVLAGFDFPFGYPEGTAARLGVGWSGLWSRIAAELTDADDNANDRFDAAARLNRALRAAGGAAEDGRCEGGRCEDGPFWGNGLARDVPALPRRRPEGYGGRHPPERRATERAVRSAQPCWKLSGAGSVGGQALTGIARLEALRRLPALSGSVAVWPFETGFDLRSTAPVVLAEVYPSLLRAEIGAARRPGEVADAAQVRVLAAALSELDRRGGLVDLLAAPPGIGGDALRAAAGEEGWILGAGREAPLREAAAAAAPGAAVG